MTTDDKYSCRNMSNFTKQFEVPLPQKQERFSGFFLAFLKCTLNFENFGKKEEYPSLDISKMIDFARGCYLLV